MRSEFSDKVNLKLEDWLKYTIGKTLAKVNATLYISCEGEESQNFQELYLEFLDGIQGKFIGGLDGETLVFKLEELFDIAMEENGKLYSKDVSESSVFSQLRGLTLRIGEIVMDADDQKVGIRLSFSNNLKLSIINLGDELFVYNEIPLKIVKEESLRFERIDGNL